MRPLRVLDLFAGLGGWSNPWRDAGHDVFTVDNNPKFAVDWCRNIMRLEPQEVPWHPDVVLASPPCQLFSVLNPWGSVTGIQGMQGRRYQTRAAVRSMVPRELSETVRLACEHDLA